MKKKIIALLLIFILATSITACGNNGNSNSGSGGTEKTEEIVIRVAHNTSPATQIQLAIAESQGFFDEAFAENNINATLDIYTFENGPAINDAFLSGSLDAAVGMGDQPAVIGIASGNEGIIVSRVTQNSNAGGIIIDIDSEITEVSELEGKKIAVALGTAGEKTLSLVLQDYGLTEDDVELVNLSDNDQILASFERNEIDAAISTDLVYAQELYFDSGIAKLLTDFSTYPSHSYVEFQKSFIDEHPEAVKAFLQALYKAELWYAENVDEGDEIVAAFCDADIEDVTKGRTNETVGLAFDDEDITNLTQTYTYLINNELIENELVVDDIINTDILKEAITAVND